MTDQLKLAQGLRLLAEAIEAPDAAAIEAVADVVPLPWGVLLWQVPAETRIGVVELCEAVGRPKSWVYRHTADDGDCPRLPHRKMDGSLVFVVGEVRRWLEEHEVTVVPGRAQPLSVKRGGRA